MSLLLVTLYFLLKWFLRIMSFGALFLFLLSSLNEAYVARQKRAVKTRSLVLSLGAAVVALLIFIFIARVNFGGRWWWFNDLILPLIGIIAGILYGKAQKVFKAGSEVYAQGGAWHILAWALSLTLLQLFLLFGWMRPFPYIVYAVLFSTAFLVATNALLILKVHKLRKPAAPVTATPSAQRAIKRSK